MYKAYTRVNKSDTKDYGAQARLVHQVGQSFLRGAQIF